MNQASRTQIWTVLGLATAAYALNGLLNDRGASTILAAPLIDDRRIAGAYFGIILIASLVSLAAEVARRYASASPQPNWCAKVPVVGLAAPSGNSLEWKCYQGFFLFAFSVFPLLVIGLLWLTLLSHGRVIPANNIAPGQKVEGMTLSTFKGFSAAALVSPEISRHCLVASDEPFELKPDLTEHPQQLSQDQVSVDPCHRQEAGRGIAAVEGGVDWIPVLSPLLLLGLSILSVFQVARLIFQIVG